MAVNGLTGWTAETNWLSVAAGIVTRPFGISVWAHDGNDATNGSIAVSGTAGITNQAHRLTTDDGGTRIVSANARTTTSGAALATSAHPANAWFHAFGAFVDVQLREARMDGGSLGTHTPARDVSVADIFTIGARADGSTSWVAGGGICSVSLWDLTDFDETERTALAALLATLVEGVAPDPRDVDAQVGQPWSGMLLAYWRLKDATDLDDLVGANDLTMNGTLTTFATESPVADADESGDPVLTADAGAFAVTGTAANLEHHRVLDAEAGAFAVTGTAAALVQDFSVAGEAGSFLITGTDATLTVSADAVLDAEGGTFTVTGTAANLEQHSVLAAASGTFAWTGTQATLTYDSVVTGTPGAYSITGTAATLRQGFTLAAEAGAFALTGTAADLLQDRRLDAAGGTFTVTGTDATLSATGAIELVADGGTFAVVGTAAGLFQGYSLSAEAGAFGVAGTVAGLLYGRLLDAEAGAFAWTGTAATLTRAAAFTPIPKYTFGPILMHRILGPQD